MIPIIEADSMFLMAIPSIIWGSPEWFGVVAALLGTSAIALGWSYGRTRAPRRVKVLGSLLKAAAFTTLALILLEPLLTGMRPRRRANAFVILTDNSQSLQIRDGARSQTRGDWLRGLLDKEATWKTRLGQDFDLRNYVFDSHLRAVDEFDSLDFEGTGSTLGTSLSALAGRFRGLPLAGVLLLTDGNRTDLGEIDTAGLPPIYPVIPPAKGNTHDIGVSNVSVSQTNFESAPVVVRADVSAVGYQGKPVVAVITDEAGRNVERQEARVPEDNTPLHFRFQFRPQRKGVSIYRVRTFAASEEKALAKGEDQGEPPRTSEQTLANNSRLIVVDQGSGPYRVLYLGGRPNWEFKFLRRALFDDDQIELVGLIRLARRQPKFDFRNARSSNASPFFDGFENPDADTAERADQPVIVRLGTRDEAELRDGFPKTADVLYAYHAIILDDLESDFFTQDQLGLIRNFVSQRGGGLLMLGGPDSLADGKYDRNPVGELLPVYLNRSADGPRPDSAAYQLELTREGWLQPWVRLRKTEDEERKDLATRPPFQTLSQVGAVKPGAVVLAQVRDPAGESLPALVAQSFGKGHVAALMIGDLWRWGMRRANPAESDLERSWRQTVRWLVGDVPGRVQTLVRAKEGTSAPTFELTTRVRDPEFRPLDNAKVRFTIHLPDQKELTLDAEPDRREAGLYSSTYVTRQPGAYRVTAQATAPDGSLIGESEAGWAAQPAADEFAQLEPNQAFLKNLAEKTKGEVVDGTRLDSFVSSLSTRTAPIVEPWTSPLWHQPVYFLVAIAFLMAEWGLRRVNGLA